MKLVFTKLVDSLAESKSLEIQQKIYIQNIAFFVIGEVSYIYEVLILILIMIELILIDELGFKKRKMIYFEDTNTAYVRMRANMIFNLKEEERFRTRELFLRALHESIRAMNEDLRQKKAGLVKSRDWKKSAQSIMRMQNVKKMEVEKDDVDIQEVIEFEKKEGNNKTINLIDTIKKIEKNIFIKSFGKFSEENKKSFRWQVFSVYSRKPGIDLSPLLNFFLMMILIYLMVFIETMSGGTQSFIDQVLTSSIVNQNVIWSLVTCIGLMILERVIFKKNPRKWREYFQYKEKNQNQPLTLLELKD